jgi:hypothetical protein
METQGPQAVGERRYHPIGDVMNSDVEKPQSKDEFGFDESDFDSKSRRVEWANILSRLREDFDSSNLSKPEVDIVPIAGDATHVLWRISFPKLRRHQAWSVPCPFPDGHIGGPDVCKCVLIARPAPKEAEGELLLVDDGYTDWDPDLA